MSELIALLVALLSALAAAEQEPRVHVPTERVRVYENTDAEGLQQQLVAEAEDVLLEDGTLVHPDGSTSCVAASPCSYAADGREWGEPELDVDPVWEVLAP